MAWSNVWDNVMPRRRYWKNNDWNTEGLGGWGGSATLDVRNGQAPHTEGTFTHDPGPASTVWCSMDNSRGDGNAVRTIQSKLNAAWRHAKANPAWIDSVSGIPANALTVDGVYGNASRAMATWFQKRNSLGADGITGPTTWSKLRNW